MASTLQRAARKASSLASRTAAAAASRASATRAAGVAAAAVARAARLGSSSSGYFTSVDDDDEEVPDDAKTPTDEDLELDEAVRALYQRWCKAFDKKRDHADHAEMVRRLKIFRHSTEEVHRHNTYVPDDPGEAAIHLQKRREAELLISNDQWQDAYSRFDNDDRVLPEELGPLSDGGDPCLGESDYELLERIEKIEARRADGGVAVK